MPLDSFNNLCNSIREIALKDLSQKRPKKQLIKWHKLVTAIVETELAIHRVRSALNLLKTIPSKETLNMFCMSEGAWIDYQYTTWSFWMCSLIDKEIELVSQVGQKLVKPDNLKYKDIIRPLIESLVSQKDKVGKVRHPLVHKGEGGVIEAVIPDYLESFAILASPVNFNQILASLVPYHRKWHDYLHKCSILVLANLEKICKELNQYINWKNI